MKLQRITHESQLVGGQYYITLWVHNGKTIVQLYLVKGRSFKDGITRYLKSESLSRLCDSQNGNGEYYYPNATVGVSMGSGRKWFRFTPAALKFLNSLDPYSAYSILKSPRDEVYELSFEEMEYLNIVWEFHDWGMRVDYEKSAPDKHITNMLA